MHKYFILLTVLSMSALSSYCSEPLDYDNWPTSPKDERRKLFERHKRDSENARKREAVQTSRKLRDGKEQLLRSLYDHCKKFQVK